MRDNMAREFFLTTTDNKWSPFTQFDEWLVYDEKEKHYNTLNYVARMTHTSHILSDELNDREIERVYDEIIKFDWLGKITDNKVHHVKVERETEGER